MRVTIDDPRTPADVNEYTCLTYAKKAALRKNAAYNGRTSRTFGSSSYLLFMNGQSKEVHPRGGKLTAANNNT